MGESPFRASHHATRDYLMTIRTAKVTLLKRPKREFQKESVDFTSNYPLS